MNNTPTDNVQALRVAAEQKSLEGDLDAALQLLDIAEQLANTNGDLLDMALVWRGRANVYQHHDQFTDSLKATQNAVAIYEQHGEPFDIAVARTIEVFVLGALERYEEAETLAAWIKPIFLEHNFLLGQAALAANLARVYTDSWQLPQALAEFQNAHQIYQKLDNPARAAKALSDMGIVAEQMDEFDLAEKYYQEAYPELVAAGDIFTIIRNQFNLAQLCLRQSRYKQALSHLHQARTDAEPYVNAIENDDTFIIAYINLYEAQVRRQLGEHTQALELLQTALAQFSDWDRRIERAQVLVELSQTITNQSTPDNLAQALIWLTEAEEALIPFAMPIFLAMVRLQKGELLLALERITEAAEYAKLAYDGFHKQKLSLRQAQAQILLADSLWQLQPVQAHDLYQQALTTVGEDIPILTIRCWHGLARIATAVDDLPNAEIAYKEAIERVQSIQHNLARHSHQAGFLADKQHLLEELLAILHHQPGREKEVAHRVEQFKASALATMLQAQPIDNQSNVQIQQLLAERAALRQKLDAQQKVFTHVETTSERQTRTAYVGQEEKQQQKLRQTRQQLRHIEEKIAYQQDASLSWREGITNTSTTDLHQLLDSQTGLVSFYEVQGRLFALTATCQPGDLQLHQLSTNLKEIAQLWQRGRRWIVRPQADMNQTKTRLGQLWQKLVTPWQWHLANKKRLLILPHPHLYPIPFAALYDKQRQQYLMDVWQLHLAPSATILTMCHRPTGETTPPLIIGYAGDPDSAEYLPSVLEEVHQIANLWPQAKILQNEQAHLENILPEMPQRSLIHIAGHAIYMNDAPLESGIPLARGEWLRATDLYLMYGHLSGASIILSGCESGRGQTIGSDILGLTSAFLYAGASSIIASLWRVDDEATMHMMISFYNALNEKKAMGTALQMAQQQVRANPNYEHPYFWAPFILNGAFQDQTNLLW